MSNLLSSSDVEPFLNRFYRFYDSVIRTVEVGFLKDGTSAMICIEAQDRESQSGWSQVKIHVQQVTEFKLIENKTTNVVISGGVFIREFDRITWISFNPYSELLECPEEFRKSTFMMAGHLVLWKSEQISIV